VLVSLPALVQCAAVFAGSTMAFLTATSSRPLVVPGLGLAAGLLAALTLIRLIGLKFSVVDLFFDEAQYWAWSREPAFGYFSKPPLIAWIIGASTSLCGGGEACIRISSPLFHAGSAIVLFFAARALYDAGVAFYAALSMALATGVVFSAHHLDRCAAAGDRRPSAHHALRQAHAR
jgi:hypothetical protein